ncbi:MAG: DivIVA domain-containing protein [Gemmatimonadaceae bacterium]|nr:DivIVA domain-containing protein [Gemmatimonadaceae bacterium]
MTDDGFHLTALDVRRYDFGNALRGYDRARVDQFRDQVAEELERLSRANQELDQKARNFHEQLKSFRERDKALNDALVSAQQLRGDIREQAEREALLIVREARAEADTALQQVREEVRRCEEELQQLWRTRRGYLAQLRTQVERQLSELVGAEREPPPPYVKTREQRADDAAEAARTALQAVLPPAAASSAHMAPLHAPTLGAPGPGSPVPNAPNAAAPGSPTAIDAPALLQELRSLPTRSPSLTPSWLDAVDDS